MKSKGFVCHLNVTIKPQLFLFFFPIKNNDVTVPKQSCGLRETRVRRKKLQFTLLLRRVEELKALVWNIHKIFYLSVFHLSPNLLICFGDDVMILSGDVVIVFLPYFNSRRGLHK